MSELFEQPNLTETVVEDEKLEDFKKSLVPLTEGEAAALAKSKDETAKADPKPSNYDEDTNTTPLFEVQHTYEDKDSTKAPTNEVAYSEVFGDLCKAGLCTLVGPSEGCSKYAYVDGKPENIPSNADIDKIIATTVFDTMNYASSFSTNFSPGADMDKVMAANTFDGGGAFSSFQNDPLENIMNSGSIVVNSKKDSFGKTYYYFDNGINANTCVVVFEVGGQTMVKISNAILRLDTLLSLEQCVVQPQTKPDLEKTNRGLRQIPLFDSHGSVECTFGDDAVEKLVVSDISIDLMMNVVAYLSQVYSPQVETQQQQQQGQEPTPAIVVEKPHEPQEESDDCVLILFSTISIAVVMNLLLTFILWQSSISGGYYNLKREYN
jgi:hypothetical protein